MTIVYHLTGIGPVSTSLDDYGLYASVDLAQCELLKYVRTDVNSGDLNIPSPWSVDDLKKVPGPFEEYDVDGYTYYIRPRTVVSA